MRSCRTVSTVAEDAHSAAAPLSSSASTRSAASASRLSLQEQRTAQWSGWERKRASSLESWLHSTLGGKHDAADKEARRAARRAKRKAFFRKMFFLPPSPEEDERDDLSPVNTPPPTSKAMFPPVNDEVPSDESSAYKLDQGYYASMASILNQYKSDCLSENGDDEDDESETEKEDCFDTSDLDSNTDMSEVSDMSEISVFDLEEGDETDDENDELDQDMVVHADFSLEAIPETELEESTTPPSAQAAPTAVVVVHDVVREMPVHVTPPVRVPMEYTLHDRRGGTLVGGKHVLFTSAAFKRKQRQMLYGMRSIDEDAQFVVPQIRDDDDDSEDELNVSGVYALQNEWI